MKLINLTNRNITIVDDEGNVRLQLKPSGLVVGVTVEPVLLDAIQLPGSIKNWKDDSIEIVTYAYHGVTGLPKPEEGTLFVVSFSVLQALDGEREDVVAPDTSPNSVIRIPNSNKVCGVMRLRKL